MLEYVYKMLRLFKLIDEKNILLILKTLTSIDGSYENINNTIPVVLHTIGFRVYDIKN